jgi:hypothetical protein
MLPVNQPRENYTGQNNLAAYDFDHKISDASQLLVLVADSDGTEIERLRGDDTSYIDSVDFDPVSGGGTVNLLSNLPTGYDIYILLAPDDPVQDNRFKDKFDFTLIRVENAFDQFVGYIQRLAYLAKYALRLHDLDSYDDFDPMLPQGVSSNTDDRIPVFSDGGFAPISQWPLLSDLNFVNVPSITGTRSAPIAVTTGGVPFSGVAWMNTWYIQGSGGAVDIVANPQIDPATSVGQKLSLVGCSDVNTVTFEDGTGLLLNGMWIAENNRVLNLEWDGTNWFETSRS